MQQKHSSKFIVQQVAYQTVEMLRQALLRLTTQALLRRNLLLHPGDPSIEPGKGRDSLITIWGCRVSRWFHPVCTSGVMLKYYSIVIMLIYILIIPCLHIKSYYSIVIHYTLHSTQYSKYQTAIKHHQASIKCYVTVFSPLNLRLLMFGPTTGG